jgi:hypothetical protein
VDSADVVVGANGAINASSGLLPGTYIVSGADLDGVGDVGTWSFTLTVNPAPLVPVPPATTPSLPTPSTSPGGGSSAPIGSNPPPVTPTPVPSVSPLGSGGPPTKHGAKLSLGHSSTLNPGESATVTGAGCNTNAPVILTINGTKVGQTTSSGEGDFSASISPPALVAGQYALSASCGPTMTTTLSMVVSSSSSEGESSAAVFAVFIIVGLFLARGQYYSNSGRRRRRSRLEEFEPDETQG